MRTHRLRWQLAAGQALLALALLVVGTKLLASRTDDLRRAEAALGAQRDAEVVATQVGRLLTQGLPVDEALAGSSERSIELTDADGSHLSGAHLSDAPAITGAVLDAVDQVGTPSVADGIQVGRQVAGIEAVVDDEELLGVVIVAEPAPVRRGWRQLYGLDPVAAVVLAGLAAATGWWLAGGLTKPLARLTDRASALVLSGSAEPAPRSRIREIAVLGTAIDRVGARIRREGSARDQLGDDLRRLSHELRTPLTTIRLRLDDLVDEGDDVDEVDASSTEPTSRTDGSLRVIAGQLDRLDRLGEQLSRLRHARPDAQPVDVRRVVDAATLRLRPLAEWGRIELQLISPREPAVVAADAEALEDAVSNVVENAIKHSPRGGRVRVVVAADRDAVTVEVTDSGPGIAESLRAAVLHPGVRVVGEQVVRGTGQGLAIVAATLDRVGGRLELGDAPGGGALVRLVLPAQA